MAVTKRETVKEVAKAWVKCGKIVSCTFSPVK